MFLILLLCKPCLLLLFCTLFCYKHNYVCFMQQTICTCTCLNGVYQQYVRPIASYITAASSCVSWLSGICTQSSQQSSQPTGFLSKQTIWQVNDTSHKHCCQSSDEWLRLGLNTKPLDLPSSLIFMSYCRSRILNI